MEKKLAFVYGTLREGLYNYKRCLEGRVETIKEATLEGFEMYSVNGMFPAVIPGKGAIVGEVMEIKDDLYDETIMILDRLEGYYPKNEYRSMYLRRTMTVTLNNGEMVDAYVYLWNRPIPGVKIKSGDWKNSLGYIDEENEILPI